MGNLLSSLSEHPVAAVVATLVAGLGMAYLSWRLRETSHQFHCFTTAEEAAAGKDLTGKLAVVTGCNVGIGKETVRVLAKQGCRVIMACRDLKKAHAARRDIVENLGLSSDTKQVTVVQLDLSSLASVEECAASLLRDEKKIDFLINNAGIMAIPEYRTTADGIEMQFGVNHLGHFYFTILLLTLVRAATKAGRQKGRIINLSSMAHQIAPGYQELLDTFQGCIKTGTFMGAFKSRYYKWHAYGTSKASNLLFSRALARRFGEDITAVSVHPGTIKATGLLRHVSIIGFLMAFPHALQVGLPKVLTDEKNIPQGASTTLRCVAMSDDEIGNGHYFYNCRDGDKEGRVIGPCAVEDGATLENTLWELSEAILKAKGFRIPRL